MGPPKKKAGHLLLTDGNGQLPSGLNITFLAAAKPKILAVVIGHDPRHLPLFKLLLNIFCISEIADRLEVCHHSTYQKFPPWRHRKTFLQF